MIKKIISKIALKIIPEKPPVETPIPFTPEVPTPEELLVASPGPTHSYLGKPLSEVPYRKPHDG